MTIYLSSVRNNEYVLFKNDTSMGQKKSESPTGIEPMASQIPVGHSNHLIYERLVVSWVIYFGYGLDSRREHRFFSLSHARVIVEQLILKKEYVYNLT